MANIRLETSNVQEINNQIPEMSATLNKEMAALVSSLETIKNNIDSEGINTILSKFNETIDKLQKDLVNNLDTAHNYLNNKISGYGSVTNKVMEQSNILSSELEELEKNY